MYFTQSDLGLWSRVHQTCVIKVIEWQNIHLWTNSIRRKESSNNAFLFKDDHDRKNYYLKRFETVFIIEFIYVLHSGSLKRLVY